MKCPECNGFGVALYWVTTTDVRRENGKYMCKAERAEQICRTCNGSGEVAMTNADRIRAMSDEELAWELMTWRIETEAKHQGIESNYPNTQAAILAWLQQLAEVE